MAGIDSTGFTVKTLEEIKTDLEAGFRSTFGASIDLEPESVDGQQIAIFAERLADAWAGIAAVYQAVFPDGADGINLDNLCALTGSARLPATYSKVDVICSGTPGTVIDAGKTLSVAGVGTKFSNVSPGTIGGGGTVVIEFRAVETGPKIAPAGTLTVIESPVAGWASATNTLDVKIRGTNLELDPPLRLRREASLRGLGNSSCQAIRSKVLKVQNVTDCFVFENTLDFPDGNGLPAHAVEVVADGGTDQLVADAIYAAKGAGIITFGTSSQAVTDSNGFNQLVKFSRPVEVDIWVGLTVIVNASLFPSDGVAQIKQAIVDWVVLNMHTGSDVRSSPLVPVIFSIPGIEDVVGLPLVGLSNPAVASTTLVLTNHQKAKFDTSRIAVTIA